MNNLEIYEEARAVPDEAKKTIKGGRLKGMTDINPMWRIKKLTEMFGACGDGWYSEIVRKEMIPYGDEIAAFVDINLYVKYESGWSKPIPGTGGAMFVAKETNGIYVCDEAYKKAYTDAISVAAKALGVGADVYWDADKTKYSETPSDPDPELEEARNIFKAYCTDIAKQKGLTVKAVAADICKKCKIEKPITVDDYGVLIEYASDKHYDMQN